MRRRIRQICTVGLALALALTAIHYQESRKMTAEATSAEKIQQNIDTLNQKIDGLNQNISEMQEKQEILEEEMEDLNAEILNTMTSIGMKEDEIEEKEEQIVRKQTDIETTEEEYDAAQKQANQQYQDMIVRLRKMYENGDESSLDLLLSGSGMEDLLNRMDYVEMVYEYDRGKLSEYQRAKDQVLELWNQLEEEKNNLEEQKANLEIDRQNLQVQKTELDGLLDKKKKQSSNYEAEIKKAKQEAGAAKKKLQQEKAELAKLQSGASNRLNGNYTTNYNEIIDRASGSATGKQIAKYACQFVGNPYVAGGTSLTNGADCSGFTYRVYADFNYSLPRTSTEQRSVGKSVNYSDAQPGDLICYSGHVALYIGGGMIVHASTQKTGIKVGNAQYREILAVRRIL